MNLSTNSHAGITRKSYASYLKNDMPMDYRLSLINDEEIQNLINDTRKRLAKKPLKFKSTFVEPPSRNHLRTPRMEICTGGADAVVSGFTFNMLTTAINLSSDADGASAAGDAPCALVARQFWAAL